MLQLKRFLALRPCISSLPSTNSITCIIPIEGILGRIGDRPFSTEDDGDDHILEDEATQASESNDQSTSPISTEKEEPASGEMEITTEDLIAMGYTKRQAAWLKPDPEKHKYFIPKLSRKERGSYSNPKFAQKFAEEMQLYPQTPNVPLYNLQEVVPEIFKPRCDLFDTMVALQKADPSKNIFDIAKELGIDIPDPPPPPSPDARPILEWESTMVLSPAIVGEEHPKNKKAKCKVHLRNLQRETGLSDDALVYIAEIAGPRYNKKTGYLTLTSTKYLQREYNRGEIMRMLDALVEEGLKLDRGEETAASG